MKVLAAGGGSGGHVTPVLAVINELAALDPGVETVFVCDKSFEPQARGLMQHARVPVTVKRIMAGKLRRYHNQSFWQRITDFEAIVLNLRDISRIVVGFFQGIAIIIQFRPDVMFAKGGFVCLPLGIAAKILGVPLVIHDSDTRPGLTNRILARFAEVIATGSPLDNYPYPATRSHYTGVPIDTAFRPLTHEEQRDAKSDIGLIDTDAPLLVVTGGGLGARSINLAILQSAEHILAAGIHIYHICGKMHYESLVDHVPSHPHYHLVPFVYKDMHKVLGAADIVVARGSATFLQEMAAMAKPVIVIPAAHLSDQVKNAQVYEKAKAVASLSDAQISQTTILGRTIVDLIASPDHMKTLSQNLHRFAKPQAAADLARLIQMAAHNKRATS
ncbi:UDP-N-acetylglucosamine--N-acetylmuramyl-(pentapeptide) pyrophosphoryl-undecaprenol N-acetylglucosamine transferase [Candidatus Saccharibacteria bacterium]|nr:UDP-N-acetylglucosamine--N-acetylmuramyl-(pentapeptide) pyrophosphoryl-undecaprenol N-acetylglucosamine transferase [Candidatus Saccharibacteria bacterium]